MNLWIIFLTGLGVGGLTCLAVQGGLLASTIAARTKETLSKESKSALNIWPVSAFLITKLAAYTALGFLLGAFGSTLSITSSTQMIIQFAVGLYMIAIALNLLNVHPIFRYAVIQPPRFLTKMIRNQSKSKDLFAPALLGTMTIFIPCGTTLAMEALAISSAHPIAGATIMAVFTLGTMPLFLGIGVLTHILGEATRGKFLKIAAVLVLYLGIASINGSLVVANSPITAQKISEAIPIEIDLSAGDKTSIQIPQATFMDGKQVANISILPNGYTPASLRVKNGIPVKLNLITQGGLGCTSVFIIPELGISKNLPLKGTTELEFTPKTPGKLTWTCSMGMYSGVIEVI